MVVGCGVSPSLGGDWDGRNLAPIPFECFSSRPSGHGVRMDKVPCCWSTVTGTALVRGGQTAVRWTYGPLQVGYHLHHEGTQKVSPRCFPLATLPYPLSTSLSPSVPPPVDLQDMSVMLLRTQGPSAIFAEYQVVLHVPESDADKVRVFHAIREYFFLLSHIPMHDPKLDEPQFFCSSQLRAGHLRLLESLVYPQSSSAVVEDGVIRKKSMEKG